MPRLSIQDFNSLSKSEMIREYNRLAEAVNRNITNLKKSGLDTGIYSPEELKRVRRIAPGQTTIRRKTPFGESANVKITKQELVKLYSEAKNKASEVSITSQQKRSAIDEQFAEAIGFSPEDIPEEDKKRFRKAVKRGNSKAAVYYQLLKKADSLGVISNYKLPDELDGADAKTASKWLLDSIEAALDAEGKQERTPEDRAALKRELEENAMRFELTTGEERRNIGGGFYQINAEDFVKYGNKTLAVGRRNKHPEEY